MSTLRASLVVLLGLAAPAQVFALADEDKPKLDGQHRVTAAERDGKALPAETIEGCTVRFTADKITGLKKDGTEFLQAEYTLEGDKSPFTIVLKMTDDANKGKEMLGLVERKDDTIRIIHAGPGGEKPTEFKTKEGQVMYTLKVEKP